MVDIRSMTGEDIASFRECLDIVARERRYLAFVEAPALEDVRRFVESNLERGAIHVVSFEAGRVVGWCDISPMLFEGFRHCGTLGMGLLPEFRGKGIGRRLLEEAIAQARSRGLTRVELDVFASNASAIALYESVGFEREGVKRKARVLDGSAEDVWVMGLLL